ncbi:hypothetical protein D3C72_809860 [compost metagenome]
MRAIGLVLIDEGRGVVEVLGRYLVARIGHAVGIDAGSGHDIGARRRDREGRRPDRHIARRALVDEVQAVVEILAEGGQQGRAAEGVGRALLDAVAVIVLVRDQVRDLTGRQGGLAHARSAVRVIGVGQADEGLAGVGQIGVGDIIAQAGSIPDQAVAHHLQQIAEVLLVHRQVESAVGRRQDDALGGQARRAEVGDGVGAARQPDAAVWIVGLYVVSERLAFGQFDHILGPQGADNGVVAAVGAENDAVRGLHARDVEGVAAPAVIDGDGREAEAGRIEVAAGGDGVVAQAGVDDDFLDIVELGDHRAIPGHDDLGLGTQAQDAVGLRRDAGIDDEGLGRIVACDREGVVAGAAINEVLAVAGIPQNGVVAAAGEDHVVAFRRVEGAGGVIADQDVGRIGAADDAGHVAGKRHRRRVRGVSGA